MNVIGNQVEGEKVLLQVLQTVMEDGDTMKRVAVFLTCVVVIGLSATGISKSATQYVRYLHEGSIYYGILEGDTIRELRDTIFESTEPTGQVVSLSDVQLLVPCEPSKVIAVGLNYRSHLRDSPVAEYPGLFAKFPTSLIANETEIVFPPGATDVHYEGEMVVVIGKRAKNVSVEAAADYVFGVTVGNDISERAWQRDDLQWFRAKGSDGFGPMGPVIVQGLNYSDLLLETRVDGETRQSQRTSDLIFGVHEVISYVSKFMTLEPGDVIFTGTPGSTQTMHPGEVIEIELEGVGVLRNKVAG